jgi:hypothetical protein
VAVQRVQFHPGFLRLQPVPPVRCSELDTPSLTGGTSSFPSPWKGPRITPGASALFVINPLHYSWPLTAAYASVQICALEPTSGSAGYAVSIATGTELGGGVSLGTGVALSNATAIRSLDSGNSDVSIPIGAGVAAGPYGASVDMSVSAAKGQVPVIFATAGEQIGLQAGLVDSPWSPYGGISATKVITFDDLAAWALGWRP